VKSLFGSSTGNDKYFLVYVMTGNGSASYYGQIVKETDDYIILKDPGYINIQPAQKEGEQPQVTYNFMKDEFFKPVSEVKIYKDKVVFVQELTNDSPIVNFYKKQLGK
jgi:IMP dehydrogenase/GMP reductase